MNAQLNNAIENIGLKRKYIHQGISYVIAFLIREEDQRPLSAPWWRGKSASVVGADINGNFFLHHCSGTVLFWDHVAKEETLIANSLMEFLNGLQFDESALP
jgi:hypothetical protein